MENLEHPDSLELAEPREIEAKMVLMLLVLTERRVTLELPDEMERREVVVSQDEMAAPANGELPELLELPVPREMLELTAYLVKMEPRERPADLSLAELETPVLLEMTELLVPLVRREILVYQDLLVILEKMDYLDDPEMMDEMDSRVPRVILVYLVTLEPLEPLELLEPRETQGWRVCQEVMDDLEARVTPVPRVTPVLLESDHLEPRETVEVLETLE